MKKILTTLALLFTLNLSAQTIDSFYVLTDGVQTHWVFAEHAGLTYDSSTYFLTPTPGVIPVITSYYLLSGFVHIHMVNSVDGLPIRRLRGYIGLYNWYH